MAALTEVINKIFGALIVVSQVAIVAGLVVVWFSRDKRKSLIRFFGEQAVLLSFLITSGAVLGSLFYSEIVGFDPCKLCWIQRIFIYPQAILFGMALKRKHKEIYDYGLVLSVLGLVVAVYQSLLERGLVPAGACAASTVSCAKIYVTEFGYVTIPIMVLTAFVILILLNIAGKKNSQHGL